MFATTRDVGTVFGVVAKLRPFCNALVSCSLSWQLDKFITHLFLSMYGSSVTKAPMSISFRECLFLTFSFNLLALWLITLESVSKCSWEIIDDNIHTRLEHCSSSCLILWWKLCMRSLQETPTSLFSDLETLFAFDRRVKLEALRRLFQLSDGFLTVHSSARATPAKT